MNEADLTVFGHHDGGAMPARLQVDDDARVLLGKVDEVLLEEITACEKWGRICEL